MEPFTVIQTPRLIMEENTIQLDQFLKSQGVVASGGEAKHLVQNGEVSVNGEVETRRGRKLKNGDSVSVAGHSFVVTLS